MAMVSGISDVAVQEYIPQETSVETEQVKADTSGPVQVDDKGIWWLYPRTSYWDSSHSLSASRAAGRMRAGWKAISERQSM